jgi:nucleotide-binding universal stress UspA family protein
VLIGSRGLGPVRRLVLGSVSEGVIREAACPVLVLRGAAASWPPARVVVGDDGSASAAAAAASAALLAGAVGARLTIAQALAAAPGLPRPETAEGHEVLAAVERGLRERAARLPAGAAEGAHVVAALDDPAALLLRLAEAVATPALIAVGSRGLRLFERLRLGSVSTKVMHAAACPVLVASQRAE